MEFNQIIYYTHYFLVKKNNNVQMDKFMFKRLYNKS